VAPVAFGGLRYEICSGRAEQMKFSVIVRTYNESRYLPQLLDTLRSQTVPADSLETVIVDSGSSDGTLQIAEDAGCRIVHIKKQEFSFGRSLNMGCNAAKGDILTFISGHCVPTSATWLQDLGKPLVSGEAALSYGRQEGGPDTKFSEHQLFGKYFPETPVKTPNPYFCNNANAALLRQVWDRYRFDEELTGLEDMELGRRLVEAGMKIAYVPSASVYHYHHESWAQVKRRYEREALALHKIMPSVHVTLADATRYFFAGVLGDWAKAINQRRLLRKAGEIVAFRFCQFLGAWRGHNMHRQVSRAMKEHYFFPH
jgi:glycosyltransferase involved in cell wall biosynthesis